MGDNYIPKPNPYEVKISKVCCLLDELDGKPFNQEHWDGRHPKIFCKRLPFYERDGELEAELTRRIRKVVDARTLSLRMQEWVRNRALKLKLKESMTPHVSGDYNSFDETADWIIENLNFTFK